MQTTFAGVLAAAGQLTWKVDGLVFAPGFLQIAAVKTWSKVELREVETRRGQPFLVTDLAYWVVVLFIALPLLTLFTLGIGLVVFIFDRIGGTYLVISTASERDWFFLKSTSLEEANRALHAYTSGKDWE